MKKILFTLFLTSFLFASADEKISEQSASTNVQSSSIEIIDDWNVPEVYLPRNYEEVIDDYSVYNMDVIRGANWLMNSPLEGETESVALKRYNCCLFLMKWAEGTPDVTIIIDIDLGKYLLLNTYMFPIFVAGWSKYELRTRKGDEIGAAEAALESAIEYYKKNESVLSKDRSLKKEMKKLIDKQSKGTLRSFIQSVLNKEENDQK